MAETTAEEASADRGAAAGPLRPTRAGRRVGGDPLLRNAYALMLNTCVSAVLGLGYWLVAARHYSDEAVGRGSAAIAAMKFLAGITAVTLTGALARFIPVSGHRTGRFVLRTYAASSLVVALAAGGFLLTLGWWGPSFGFLRGPLPAAAFVAAVVGWSLMTLQDGVLTGLRRAVWVPVGNTVFSAGKLVLLVALAAVLPATGVFVSWAAAIGLSVLPLGWLVLRRLAPRHAEATAGPTAPPTAREVGRFLAGDYTGSLFALAVVYLVPVIVAAQISVRDNAYFYITSTIGGTIDLLAINMGASLTVEGAHDPARIAANLRAALGRMARIMVPLCLLLVCFAPRLLGVFGPAYAERGTPLLRLMALATLTRVVFEAYFGVLRAMSRTSRVAFLQGLLCVLVLGSTVVLLPVLGIVGAGVAELASQSVVAVIACRGLVRLLRESGAGGPGAGGPAGPEPPGPSVDQDTLVLGTGFRPPVDEDTLPLGVRLDFEHLERRPFVPPGPRPTARTAPPAPPRPAPDGTTGRPAADRGARAARFREWCAAGAGWLLLAVALALYWVPLRGVDDASLDRMNGLGLISVLPGATLAGAALLVAAFCWSLWLPRPQRWLPLAVLLATVVSLHAVPALLEAQPRFATAWQHVGFVEYVDRTGSTRPYLDARFSWPGFFALVAMVTRAAGIGGLTGMLRWWPTAMELLYLAPLALVLKAVRAGRRAKWCAAWLFALSCWVGQDYFSPQSLNVALYLLFVGVLLVWFRPAPRHVGRRVPGEADRPDGVPRRELAVLLGVLVAVFAASVVSHQLTPFVMLGTVSALVLWRRSTPRGLPLLCGVMVAGWVGFLAEPYWSGHFADLFGGLGSLGGNVSSGVAGRMHGVGPHQVVLYARVLLAATVLGLGGLGWLRRRRAGVDDRAMLILLVVPFLGLALQSYGGEMALRVFLFALPGASVLGALAFYPRIADEAPRTAAVREAAADPPQGTVAARAREADPPGARGRAAVRVRRRPHWVRGLALLLVGQVLMFGFLVARWGNEAFERVRTGEVAAMDYVYAHDSPSARVLWPTEDPVGDVTPNMPWGARDMDRVSYRGVLAPVRPTRVGPLVAALRAAGPGSYLMITTGTATYLEMDAGYPAHWRTRVVAALDARPDLRRVMSDRDADVYALARPARGPVPPAAPGRSGPVVTWTPWTVAGAVAAVALLVLLGGREAARLLVDAERRRTGMRVTFYLVLPLLSVFLASLVDRFATLS